MNIPTYIEKGAVKNHAADIARLGSRALIITGRNSAKENGALRDVLDVMEETGTRYEIFDEISENPPVSEIMRARGRGIGKGCDFVIGIGGGSPMDAAKAVSILLFYNSEKEDFLYTKPDKNKGRAEQARKQRVFRSFRDQISEQKSVFLTEFIPVCHFLTQPI